MKRFLTRAALLGLFTLLLAAPAMAQRAPFQQDPGDLNPVGGCSPNDQCCVCKTAAIQKYNSCVSSKCNEFPVNITGWTKALCMNQCASVKAQDIINCTIDGKCA